MKTIIQLILFIIVTLTIHSVTAGVVYNSEGINKSVNINEDTYKNYDEDISDNYNNNDNISINENFLTTPENDDEYYEENENSQVLGSSTTNKLQDNSSSVIVNIDRIPHYNSTIDMDINTDNLNSDTKSSSGASETIPNSSSNATESNGFSFGNNNEFNSTQALPPIVLERLKNGVELNNTISFFSMVSFSIIMLLFFY